jgi:hypothetical protein
MLFYSCLQVTYSSLPAHGSWHIPWLSLYFFMSLDSLLAFPPFGTIFFDGTWAFLLFFLASSALEFFFFEIALLLVWEVMSLASESSIGSILQNFSPRFLIIFEERVGGSSSHPIQFFLPHLEDLNPVL